MKYMYKIGVDSERCVLTNRCYYNDDIAITIIGPVGLALWGTKPVQFLKTGEARLPDHLFPLYEAAYNEAFVFPENDNIDHSQTIPFVRKGLYHADYLV